MRASLDRFHRIFTFTESRSHTRAAKPKLDMSALGKLCTSFHTGSPNAKTSLLILVQRTSVLCHLFLLLVNFVDFRIPTALPFFFAVVFFFLLSAADLDQQDYRTADLPTLPLPRSTQRQPTPREAQQIQRMIQRMLSFEPRQRPSLNEVVAAFENFVRRFPMS